MEPGAGWEIALPGRASPVSGVRMAGFTARRDAVFETSLVPFPAVTLIISLGDDFAVESPAQRGSTGSLALGLAPSGVRGSGRSIECLQIRCSPVAAYTLFGAAPEACRQVVALEDLLGYDAAKLVGRVREATTWQDRFDIATAALVGRRSTRRDVDGEVTHAWRLLRSSGGAVRVDTIAAEVGWSRKRLWQRFRSQIGLTPKQAARLVRLDQAAHELAQGRPAAVVAADCGYFDQSHLHRDAAALAQMTPVELSRASWLEVDEMAWSR